MTIKNYTMPDSQSIVCLGDSITAGYYDEEGLGYVARLSQAIAKDHPLRYGVLNAGISGDTIVDAWHNLISQVTHIDPNILIIKVGVNDVCICEREDDEERQVPPLNRLIYWQRIFSFVQKMGWKTLIVGPLPVETAVAKYTVGEQAIEGYSHFRYENADIIFYNDALEKAANVAHIPFLRLYEQWHNRLHDGLFTDGLHPNAKGHALLAQQIYDKLKHLKYVG